jgi:hypothetical protein
MKMAQITYERLVKTDDFENHKLSITVDIEDGDKPDQVYHTMKTWVAQQLRVGIPGNEDTEKRRVMQKLQGKEPLSWPWTEDLEDVPW